MAWTNPETFTAGQTLTAASMNAIQANITGLHDDTYRYVTTVYFTASGTFTKASYPYLRAMRITTIGGGGGSGSADATGAGQASVSAGGGGGGYAMRFYTDISALDASVTVTVGAGGSGGAVAAEGTGGGTSSFGGSGDAWYTRAGGGANGPRTGTIVYRGGRQGGAAGAGLNGDLLGRGEPGTTGFVSDLSQSYAVHGGAGGGSVLGGGGAGSNAGTSGATPSSGAANTGGGAGGPANGQSQGSRNGGAGGSGIVIVELYG